MDKNKCPKMENQNTFGNEIFLKKYNKLKNELKGFYTF